MISNNNKKRHAAKRVGHPEHQRGVKGNPSQQASWRKQEQQNTPSNQEWESL
jgi:hypothetical protein